MCTCSVGSRVWSIIRRQPTNASPTQLSVSIGSSVRLGHRRALGRGERSPHLGNQSSSSSSSSSGSPFSLSSGSIPRVELGINFPDVPHRILDVAPFSVAHEIPRTPRPAWRFVAARGSAASFPGISGFVYRVRVLPRWPPRHRRGHAHVWSWSLCDALFFSRLNSSLLMVIHSPASKVERFRLSRVMSR